MQLKFPKLHVFLGAGGVGKTTLSAAFALSLANTGKKVGLLSIDPAKRLQTALGVEHLSEIGVLISLPQAVDGGELRAAILIIGESLSRWVEDKGLPLEKQEKLFDNPYFSALSEKLASSVDTLAAIRIAEWVEQYPDVEELVIDTAPGIHAIDFIVKPEKIISFLDSKLVDWLKWFVGSSYEKKSLVSRLVKSSARKILEGLSYVGGKTFLVNFGEFLTLLDEVIVTALERLKFAQLWIQHQSTQIFLVCSVRADSVAVGKKFEQVLSKIRIPLKACIVNRTFPENLNNEKALHEFLNEFQSTNMSEHFFSNYISSFLSTQKDVITEVSDFSSKVIQISISATLNDGAELRLTDLSLLGDVIRFQAQTKVLGGLNE